jgi:hypothetical protein
VSEKDVVMKEYVLRSNAKTARVRNAVKGLYVPVKNKTYLIPTLPHVIAIIGCHMLMSNKPCFWTEIGRIEVPSAEMSFLWWLTNQRFKADCTRLGRW